MFVLFLPAGNGQLRSEKNKTFLASNKITYNGYNKISKIEKVKLEVQSSSSFTFREKQKRQEIITLEPKTNYWRQLITVAVSTTKSLITEVNSKKLY